MSVDVVKICSQMLQLTCFGAHVLDFIDIKAINMHICPPPRKKNKT